MKFLTTLIFFIFCTASWAQNEIKTEIKAENVFELSIIDVYPEKFPIVSVVFQAKNSIGKPLWLLKKSEIKITENGDECRVVKLVNITTNKPLNIALVFDHSGSMVDDPAQMPEGIETMQEVYFNFGILPEGYVMPIEFAKKGVYSFINDNHNSEDSVMFVGFSSQVDEVSPLTNNLAELKPYIDAVKPFGRTAFYDALYESIEKLGKRNSQSAVVAITDGQDNESTHSYHEVIEHANIHNIPIYIIGLGDVDEFFLEEITTSTDGFFYHTNDPNQLEYIYKNIKEQLRSIYQVDYESMSDDYISEERTLKFSFLNDTLTFSNSSTRFLLPKEALTYLENKEKERLEKIESDMQDALNEKLIFGGIGVSVLLLGIGSFLYFRRKKVSIEVNKIFPNPFNEKVTINYTVSDTVINPELKIMDNRGKIVAVHEISNENQDIEIDTTNLRRGVYIFKISGNGKVSNAIKGVKQ